MYSNSEIDTNIEGKLLDLFADILDGSDNESNTDTDAVGSRGSVSIGDEEREDNIVDSTDAEGEADEADKDEREDVDSVASQASGALCSLLRGRLDAFEGTLKTYS